MSRDAVTAPNKLLMQQVQLQQHISPSIARRSAPAEYCEMKRRLAEDMWILEPDSALMNHKRHELSAHLCWWSSLHSLSLSYAVRRPCAWPRQPDPGQSMRPSAWSL